MKQSGWSRFFMLAIGVSLLLSALLLSACKTAFYYEADNHVMTLGSDSHIIIHQDIEVEADRTRVFFQRGGVTTSMNHYHPNCNLEVRKLDKYDGQSIRLGRYTITDIRQYEEEVVQRVPRQQVLLAALGRYSLASSEDGSNTDIYRGIHFWLTGDDDNLMRLSCRGAYALPHEAELPSLPEIRASLGELISISL